jgi:hypothetical protein
LENLSKRESIILSCSHVFHKFCIQNFEKFTSTKKCPICRCSNYESKEYLKDKEYFINKNIILIQKLFRGYKLRIYLYRTIYKFDMPNNKHLRSIYSYWKIKELTNKMCSIIEKQDKETKTIINKLEKELTAINKKNKVDLKSENLDSEFNNWSNIIETMKHKKHDNCAICFGQFEKKEVYILNCSHCFHKNCLDSFEKFDTYYEKRCPICRRNYKKKEFKFN